MPNPQVDSGTEPPASAPPVSAARKPPHGLFKYLVNPVMRMLLRSPLGARMGGVLLLLTFKGRKSGATFTTPVGYHRRDGELVVFTESPWWRNLRGGAPVRLLLERRRVRAWADATDDPAVVLEYTQYFLPRVGVRNARRLALTIPGDREPSADELRAALHGHAVVRLKVEASAPT
ncbi:MAG TPA: nitroreductase/quinone reductase family protein [Chloroflexia bacterium]|nr:nitroreductase/quinone reductase family protein [Chloroflexia bacterium]